MNYLEFHLNKNVNFFTSYFDGKIILSDRASFPAFRDVFRRDDYNVKINDKDLVIMDIGANIGCGSLYFLINYDVKKVYAYELMPEALRFFGLNSKLNKFEDKVELCTFGLSDKSKTLNFHYDGINSRMDTKGKYKLRLKGFDDEYNRVLKKEGKVDLVKMDVEGSEKEIIENSKVLSKVKHLIIELHGSPKEKRKMSIDLKNKFKFLRVIDEDLLELKN